MARAWGKRIDTATLALVAGIALRLAFGQEADGVAEGTHERKVGNAEQEYSALDLDVDVQSSLPDEGADPEILGLVWSVGDSTVEAIIDFNVVPVRYSVYALEQPDRIVVDCFATRSRVTIDKDELPMPVKSAELAEFATEPGLEFIRLVLRTVRAVDYSATETPTRVRIVLDWNTRLERQKIEEEALRKRRRRLVFLVSGAAVLTGVTTAILIANNAGDDPASDDLIPAPSIPTP